jgi:hypothetical protein
VAEAGWFADKLNESDLAVEGLVVNRVHPSFGPPRELPDAPDDSALAVLVANLRAQQVINSREEATLSELVIEVAPSPVARVPLLDVDVSDMDGLTMVADHIFGHAGAPVGAHERTGLA